MLAVRQSYLDENPETCLAFLRGWLQAVEVFQNDPDSAADIMLAVYREQKYDLDESIIRSALSRLVVNPEYIPELPDYITAQSEALVKAGRLDKVPDPKTILHSELLEQAMKG